MLSYQDALQIGIQDLKIHDILNADLDAWYLLSHICGFSKTDYLLCRTESISEHHYSSYRELLSRRIEHEPIQYIIGEQEFMGLKFSVNKDVLIPRQDTEILAELVMSQCKGKKILDVCTGSGCIAISLAKLGEPKSVSALDISPEALHIAKKNAARNGVEIEFIKSDMFEKVAQVFDIIVSNPPYIKRKEIDTLMPEVKEFEPLLALDGDIDGLEYYKILTTKAKNYLAPEGKVFFEIGYEQAEEVVTLLSENGYYDIRVTKDYANLDRVVSARIVTIQP